MVEVKLEDKKGVPQFYCSECGHCKSAFGVSLNSIKNRGCCYYYPKFNLFDIQNMIQDDEGVNLLKKIIKMKNTKIYHYYIQTVGSFDHKGYEKFLKETPNLYESIHDKSMLFRTCPFVISSKGCSIPVKYRSYVCNLFVCEEVLNKAKNDGKFDVYIKERDDYIRYIKWENYSLQMMLENNKIDLIHNFDECINALKKDKPEKYSVENFIA